jgi:hypothetical protein
MSKLQEILAAGPLSIQVVSTRLQRESGFVEALDQARITWRGAIQKFIDLFPEFVVEGDGPQGPSIQPAGVGRGGG